MSVAGLEADCLLLGPAEGAGNDRKWGGNQIERPPSKPAPANYPHGLPSRRLDFMHTVGVQFRHGNFVMFLKSFCSQAAAVSIRSAN